MVCEESLPSLWRWWDTVMQRISLREGNVCLETVIRALARHVSALGDVVCKNLTKTDSSESQMQFFCPNGFQMPIGHIFKKYVKIWTSLKLVWSN